MSSRARSQQTTQTSRLARSIACSSSIPGITSPTHGAYASKLATALAHGGFVMVVDFTLESHLGPPRHARLAPDKVVDELTTAGLAAEIVRSELPEQYVVVGRRR